MKWMKANLTLGLCFVALLTVTAICIHQNRTLQRQQELIRRLYMDAWGHSQPRVSDGRVSFRLPQSEVDPLVGVKVRVQLTKVDAHGVRLIYTQNKRREPLKFICNAKLADGRDDATCPEPVEGKTYTVGAINAPSLKNYFVGCDGGVYGLKPDFTKPDEYIPSLLVCLEKGKG
jgi:hypothetical protein